MDFTFKYLRSTEKITRLENSYILFHPSDTQNVVSDDILHITLHSQGRFCMSDLPFGQSSLFSVNYYFWENGKGKYDNWQLKILLNECQLLVSVHWVWSEGNRRNLWALQHMCEIKLSVLDINISFSNFGTKLYFDLFCRIIFTYLELPASSWSSVFIYSLTTLQLISILWRMSNIWLMDKLLLLKWKKNILDVSPTSTS